MLANHIVHPAFDDPNVGLLYSNRPDRPSIPDVPSVEPLKARCTVMVRGGVERKNDVVCARGTTEGILS